jgi:hypothetical protein
LGCSARCMACSAGEDSRSIEIESWPPDAVDEDGASYTSRMKRLLSLLTFAVMLHLSLVGADNVCASHAVKKAAPSGGEGAHHHGMPMTSHGREKEKCDTPVSPDCCIAMTSCAPTIALWPPAQQQLALLHVSHPADRVESAPSRVTAPEPPPPRA